MDNVTLSNKNFTHQMLRNHMRSHTGEKLYVYNTCRERFSQLRGLQKHVNLHISYKVYVNN